MTFPVKQPDIVQRQQADIDRLVAERQGWLDEIERLRDELETWKDHYHAEHQDHEALVKALEDEERNGR